MADEILNGALRSGADCIDIERLGRYVDGALEVRERQTVQAHVEACVTCQSEIALLQSFAETRLDDNESAAVRDIVAELNRRPSPISSPREESRARRSFPLGMLRAIVATAVLVLVVGSVVLFRSSAPPLPSDIGAGRGDVTRSLRVTLGGPLGDQQTAPTRLEWRPVAGAARYHVRLLEVDRSELWSADVTSAAVDLPATVRSRIVPAKTLLWDVTAYGSGGAVLATSDAQRFRLVQ